MAGSYNHITTDDGNLVANEYFPNVIENLGDAYEAIEELYGMIWWLADLADDGSRPRMAALVQQARRGYQAGLEIARRANGASDAQSAPRLTATERKAVEVIASGEWPDSPKHGTWRAECMVAWLKAAGVRLITENELDRIHSDGFRQGLGPEPFA